MKRQEIRDYILKYKDSHSKSSVVDTLVKHGASRTMVETVYREIEQSNSGGMSVGMIILIVCLVMLIPAMLIIGALVFSFVDFGATLPNKIDLNNNIRGDASNSIAYSNDYGDNNRNEVWIVFTYMGAKQAKIYADGGKIDSIGGDCFSYAIENLAIDSKAGCSSENEYCDSLNASTTFLNGQTGVMKFVCDNSEFGGDSFELVVGDVVEGEVVIDIENPKTALKIPSRGDIWLSIGQ